MVATKLTVNPFGRPRRWYQTIDSTNRVALEWAREGAPEGALVGADQQTQGRGRWGRQWITHPGSALMFSLVLKPSFPVERGGLLTTAAGVACADALREVCDIDAGLKWPNDVIANAKKLAGILVESRTKGGAFEAAVMGMGLNLLAVPPEAGASATSLEELLGPERPQPPKEQLLQEILDRFRSLYESVAADPGHGRDSLVARASGLSTTLGTGVVLRWADGTTQPAHALSLLADGSLEVEVEGRRQAVEAAEVLQVRPS